jgi:hypothetical protein
MTAQVASHGRGGAGNMARADQSPKLTAADLATPSLKTPIVTTGRGGNGNMAKNRDPYETRMRQDVEAVTRRPSSGAQHAGRGGAGNVFRSDEVDDELSRRRSNTSDNAISDENDSVSHANKGKKWFFGKKA